ncbi:MAG: MAC/perforin domain-containing protein [Acidobacteriota bacterium]
MTYLPGVDMLGYLYDILGEYADASSTEEPVVIDGIQNATETTEFSYDGLADATYEVPTTCFVQNSTPTTEHFQADGENFEEFTRDTQAKLSASGDYGSFSGSIDVSYGEDVMASSEYYYSTIFDTSTGYVLRIRDESAVLIAEVQTALDDFSISPADFFSTYGTHVVVGVEVGGQCRYWAYGSKETFESLSEFNINVGAAYAGLSGSASYDDSVGTKAELVASTTGVEVFGGTTEGRTGVTASQDYSGWAATIPYQPAVIGFADSLLRPIWEFCSDDATTNADGQTRAEELEAAFEELYVPLRSNAVWHDIDGQDYDKYKEVRTDDPEEFAVGFGATVNTNGNLERVGMMVENVRSGERHWITSEGGDFEKQGEVPAGCALTGIALSAGSDKVKQLKLYYQRVNEGHSTNDGSALDRTVYEMLDIDHDSWELDSETSSGNTKALSGFRVYVKNNDGKKLSQIESDFAIAADS